MKLCDGGADQAPPPSVARVGGLSVPRVVQFCKAENNLFPRPLGITSVGKEKQKREGKSD